MIISFRFASARDNFMARLSTDGKRWTINSDVIARITVRRLDPSGRPYEPTFGVTVPAGIMSLKKLTATPQADAIRKGLYALPLSLKEKDDAWLEALRLDGHKRVGRVRLRLRLRGYLTKLWRYAKVPSK